MIRVFMSCTFTERDRPVVEHIRALLQANDFVPVTALPSENVSVDRPPEKIRSDVLKADCLMAVLTKSSSWIQNEIGMAFMARKPIVVLTEEPIQDTGGIAPFITDIVRFERDKIYLLADVVKTLRERITKFLVFGHKLDWYGEAVYEIISRMETAESIDVLGRSTESFFDAFNSPLELLIKRRSDAREALAFNVHLVRSDDDQNEVRPSAKRVMAKWLKRHGGTGFFLLPPWEPQLRAILFDRETQRAEGFVGHYSVDGTGLFLGVTNQLERFDRSSPMFEIVNARLRAAVPYALKR